MKLLQLIILFLFVSSSAVFAQFEDAYLYESFEDCDLPDGWSQDGGAKEWLFGNVGDLTFIDTNNPFQDHSCYAYVDVHPSDNRFLVSPVVDLSRAKTPRIALDAGGWLGGLVVEMYTASTGWQAVGESIGNWSTNWAFYDYPLPNFTNTEDAMVQFRFSHSPGSWSYGLGIDNVRIYESADAALISMPSLLYLTPGTHPVSALASVRHSGSAFEAKFMVDYDGEALHLNAYFVEDELNYPQECADSPYHHPLVVREMFGGVWGWDDFFPQSIEAGDKFTKSIQYTVPSEFDLNNAKLTAFVQEFGDLRAERKVVNAVDGWLIESLEGNIEPSVAVEEWEDDLRLKL